MSPRAREAWLRRAEGTRWFHRFHWAQNNPVIPMLRTLWTLLECLPKLATTVLTAPRSGLGRAMRAVARVLKDGAGSSINADFVRHA